MGTNLGDLASKGNKWLLRFAFTNLEWANNEIETWIYNTNIYNANKEIQIYTNRKYENISIWIFTFTNLEWGANSEIESRTAQKIHYIKVNILSFHNLVREKSFIVLIQPFWQYGLLYYSAPESWAASMCISADIFQNHNKLKIFGWNFPKPK